VIQHTAAYFIIPELTIYKTQKAGLRIKSDFKTTWPVSDLEELSMFGQLLKRIVSTLAETTCKAQR